MQELNIIVKNVEVTMAIYLMMDLNLQESDFAIMEYV
jgi:hypothetical protein